MNICPHLKKKGRRKQRCEKAGNKRTSMDLVLGCFILLNSTPGYRWYIFRSVQGSQEQCGSYAPIPRKKTSISRPSIELNNEMILIGFTEIETLGRGNACSTVMIDPLGTTVLHCKCQNTLDSLLYGGEVSKQDNSAMWMTLQSRRFMKKPYFVKSIQVICPKNNISLHQIRIQPTVVNRANWVIDKWKI